jgi:hypothetical protein
MYISWENHHCEKHGNTQISPNLSRELWKRLAPGMPGRSYQTKPGLPSGRQVNIKCFYAKGTCSVLALIIETSAVWPWYRRSFQDICRGLDNYSRAYLWLISHDLSHGVPLMCIGLCILFTAIAFAGWRNLTRYPSNCRVSILLMEYYWETNGQKVIPGRYSKFAMQPLTSL